MYLTPTTITAYLEELVGARPNEFPGVDSDERKNAKRCATAIAVLRQKCEPLYAEAAQACLRKDIAEIQSKINNSMLAKVQETKVLLNQLLLDKLRYLNGHGPQHLQAVDAKAYELLDTTGLALCVKPYEVFFLAAALIIHDAGLIFGRDGHESNIKNILRNIDENVINQHERNTIELIAAAHGGHVINQPNNKATIDGLNTRTQVRGKLIREQMIASIVRLADELAEDRTRSTAIPFATPEARRNELAGSEIFHVYSTCLESCYIDGKDRTIQIQYLLNLEDALTRFMKGSNEVYILDEIYSRVLKCFSELMYCNRFIYDGAAGNSLTLPTSIRASVEIYEKDEARPLFSFVFTLKESGYPSMHERQIALCCPEIRAAMITFGITHSVSEGEVTTALHAGPTGAALAEILKKAMQKPDNKTTEEISESVDTKKIPNSRQKERSWWKEFFNFGGWNDE